jgi:hypothetical protein
MAGTGGTKHVAKPTRGTAGRLLASSACSHRPARNVIAALPVSGVRNTSNRFIASQASPVKRASSAPGSSVMSGGGMNRPHIVCHSAVAGKLSRHHWRQRATVRGETASFCAKRMAAAGVGPRSDSSSTASARCTRRPRKRTDTAVVRLRHCAQQKLNRLAKSSRTSLGQLRGLRGKWAWCSAPPQGQPWKRVRSAKSWSIWTNCWRNLMSVRRTWHTMGSLKS